MILKIWNQFLFVFREISLQIREKTEAARGRTEKHPGFGNVYYHQIGVGLRDVFTGSPLTQRYRLDMCRVHFTPSPKHHIDNKSVCHSRRIKSPICLRI